MKTYCSINDDKRIPSPLMTVYLGEHRFNYSLKNQISETLDVVSFFIRQPQPQPHPQPQPRRSLQTLKKKKKERKLENQTRQKSIDILLRLSFMVAIPPHPPLPTFTTFFSSPRKPLTDEALDAMRGNPATSNVQLVED